MTELTVIWLPAFIMGLLGSAHCMGMCGGLTVALSSGCEPSRQATLSLVYQLFRVCSYAILGGITGALGDVMSRWTDFPVLMIAASVLLIMMGLYLMGRWSLLTVLEKQGGKLWKYVAPVQKKFLPIRNFSQAASIGLLWGLLPCGLVYSALAVSAASGSAINGVVTMLAFGLGTLPALYITGVFAKQLLQWFKKPWLRTTIGIIFIVWGSYQMYTTLVPANDMGSHQHHHHHH
ncbi:sulfite exporter TauE/SafE family protein [Kangiella spongicola]|uniref:Sulfite exporter TauE/SafE family protein n=1 Tax=Kangiella spongicola TaxID=796379 RepID=A0A318D2F8_9GAMM|nr:sulfite exporter TauE/SafE family protein [Kangiella spongicola]PXF63416.1 sulfite exporter TauE/SafE family protein [Kangiella spongicola]